MEAKQQQIDNSSPRGGQEGGICFPPGKKP
jgi:hypothetical protein